MARREAAEGPSVWYWFSRDRVSLHDREYLVAANSRREWRCHASRGWQGLISIYLGLSTCTFRPRLVRSSPYGYLQHAGQGDGGPGAPVSGVRRGFPSVRSICLAWWSTGPRCGLTDDFSAPCWSVRRRPTHGRLTPCGN